MYLTSPSGMAHTHTALIINRLKAALPTMVPAPSGPSKKLAEVISMRLSRISGALEPKAISVRFATVEFQTYTVIALPVVLLLIRLFAEVIFSIPAMNTSEMTATPRNVQKRPSRYKITRTGFGQSISLSPKRGRMSPLNLHLNVISTKLGDSPLIEIQPKLCRTILE